MPVKKCLELPAVSSEIKATPQMGLYLLVLKIYAAAQVTARYTRNGDASFHAGIITWLQIAFLLFLGHGLSAILFSGVFIFTLWYGFFNLLSHLQNYHTLWIITVLIGIPFLAHF